MSEKYILMGRGIPSIIPNDQTTPGTRLTATEARQYARRLVELADELNPADPPPAAQPGEDARIAEIRTLVTPITSEEMSVKANYGMYFMVRGMYTGHVFADVPILREGDDAKTQAEFIAAAPAAIRDLLTHLDAVTKRAERAEKALIPFASVADSFNFQEGNKPLWANYPSLRIEHFRDAVRVVRGLDDPKESTDG